MFKKLIREKRRFELHFYIRFALLPTKKADSWCVQLQRKDRATSTQIQLSEDGRVSFEQILDVDIALFAKEKGSTSYKSKLFSLILFNNSTNEAINFEIDIASYVTHDDQSDHNLNLQEKGYTLLVQLRTFADNVCDDDRNFFMEGNREHHLEKLQIDLARARGMSTDSSGSFPHSHSNSQLNTVDQLNDRKLSVLFNETSTNDFVNGGNNSPSMQTSSYSESRRRMNGYDSLQHNPQERSTRANFQRGSLEYNRGFSDENRRSIVHRYSTYNLDKKERLMSVGIHNERDMERVLESLGSHGARLFSVTSLDEVDDAIFLAAQSSNNRGFSQINSEFSHLDQNAAKYFYSDDDDDEL